MGGITIVKNLFVYGTLRKGFGLNIYLGSAKYLSEGTLNNHRMYIMPFGVPFITPEEKYDVHGELYELSDNFYEYIIERLDLIETGYTRTKKKIQTEYGEEEAEVYIISNMVDGRPLDSGDFTKLFKTK